MQRRKFVSLILSGMIVPEYLLRGRSMVSVPQMSKIPTYNKHDFLIWQQDFLMKSEYKFTKDYFKCVTVKLDGFMVHNYATS